MDRLILDGSKVVDGLKTFLEAIPDDRPGNRITMSAIGKCARQNAYKHHNVAPEKKGWRQHIIFDDGDNSHDQLRGWLQKSLLTMGWQLVDEELEVRIKTPKGYELRGHVDGRIKSLDNDDQVLLEVKTMSSASFDRLNKKKEPIEESYQRQMDAYLRGLGTNQAVFLAKNKDNGELCFRNYFIQNDLLDARLRKIDEILDSKEPNQVSRDYEADKNGKIPWNCAYCSFWKPCWEGKAVMNTGLRGGKFLTLKE